MVVAFVYLDYKESDTHNVRNVAANLLKQIVARLKIIPESLFESLDNIFKRSNLPDVHELKGLILRCIDAFHLVYVVIDALDECEDQRTRFQIFDLLTSFKRSDTRIMITSRQELPEQVSGTIIPIHSHDSDIKTYVKNMLEYKKWDTKLKDEIVSKIILKAEKT